MEHDQSHSGFAPEFLNDSKSVHSILQNSGIGIWELLADTNTVSWDDHCKQLFGIAKGNNISYSDAIKFIHADDVEEVNKAVADAMQGKNGGKYDMRYRTIGADDAKLRWVHFVGQAIFKPNGELIRFGGIAQDRTEAQATLDSAIALKQSEEIFRNVFEQAPMAIGLLHGREMFIEAANDNILEIWGKDTSIIGKQIIDALPELKGQVFIEWLEKVYDTGEPFYGDAVNVRLIHDGILQDVYVDFTYTPIKDEKSKVVGVMVLATEVTDKVMAKNKLRESEQQFRELAESLPQLVFITSPEGAQTYASGKWKEFTGLDPFDETTFKKMVHPEDYDNVVRVWTDSLLSGKGYITELRLKSKDGSYYWFYANADPIKNEKGVIEKWIGSFTNINDQKNNETKLSHALDTIKISEATFKNVTNSSPTGLWLSDQSGGLIYLNTTLVEWTGMKYEDLLGTGWVNAIIEEDRQPAAVAFKSAIASRTHYDVKFRIKKNDGKIIWCNAAGDPYYHEDNTYAGYAGFCMDIDESVKERLKTEVAEYNLRGAIELAELATWSLDIESQTFSYSKRFMDWLGFNEDTKDLDAAYNPLPEEFRQQVADAIAATVQSGPNGIYENEHPIINRVTGQERIIHAQGQVNLIQDTNRYVLRGTAQDVTRQRALQKELEYQVQIQTEELASANEELQSANEEMTSTNEELFESNRMLIQSNQQLEQYAYVASHDLQEPLRKIRTYSDRLKHQKDLSPEVSNLTVKIEQSALRMSRLINDLLEFSRLFENNALLQPVDLKSIATNVVNDFEVTIEATSATIEIRSLPVIQGVGLQMNQLFHNLISNALKFIRPDVTPSIKIYTRSATHDEVKPNLIHYNPNANYFQITVSDNGIGFEPEYKEHVFEIFKRLHTRETYPGSGIGLAICRRIIDNHHGYISVDSQPDHGTSFHIILPDTIIRDN